MKSSRRKQTACRRPGSKAVVFRQIGRAARSRGQISEERVESMLELLDSSWPIWIFSGRRTTREEDRSGKDFIFQSDIGKLFIQIKSSQQQADKFVLDIRARRSFIQPVVVTAQESNQEIQIKIIEALYQIRARIFERRGK